MRHTLYFLGVDPGAHGGAVLLDEHGKIVNTPIFTAKNTPGEIAGKLRAWHTLLCEAGITGAGIEAVHAMPKQGVVSTFKFGRSLGWWHGVIAGLSIPILYEPRPQTWQKDMGCLTKGDKGVSRMKAHHLWPDRMRELTNDTADAALIAEWTRREAMNAHRSNADAPELDGKPEAKATGADA